MSEAAQTIDINNFDLPSRREDSKYYTLQKMNQLHHEIVRRIVVGQKDIDIANALDITQATVQYVKRSPIVKQKIDIMMGARDASTVELQKQINALAPLALHEMSKIMIDDGAPHGVRANIGKDILDRAGFKPANVNINKDEGYTKEQLEEIKQRAKGAGILFEVEEAEYTEEESGGTQSDEVTSDSIEPSLDNESQKPVQSPRTESELDKEGTVGEQPSWNDGSDSDIKEDES